MTSSRKSLIVLRSPSTSTIHHKNRLFLWKTIKQLNYLRDQDNSNNIGHHHQCRIHFEPQVPNIDFYVHYYSDLLTMFAREKIYDPNVMIMLWDKGTNYSEEFKVPEEEESSADSITADTNNNGSTLDDSGQEEKQHVLSVMPTMEESITQWKEAQSSGDPKCNLHERSASGGTFDHVHMGHYLLLTYHAMIYKHNQENSTLVVGISGDELLKNKKHAELLAPYPKREATVRSILNELRPGMNLNLVQLHEPCGPTIVDATLTAMVVSSETAPGAAKINSIRKEKGMESLEIYIVPCIQAKGNKEKMSSSMLRALSGKLGVSQKELTQFTEGRTTESV